MTDQTPGEAYIERCLEQLETALQKISDVGNEDIPITGNLSREAASLWVCLAQCVDVARAALGEKKDG